MVSFLMPSHLILTRSSSNFRHLFIAWKYYKLWKLTSFVFIMFAMVTDKSLLTGHGFPKNFISWNLLVLQLLFYTLWQLGSLICTTMSFEWPSAYIIHFMSMYHVSICFQLLSLLLQGRGMWTSCRDPMATAGCGWWGNTGATGP